MWPGGRIDGRGPLRAIRHGGDGSRTMSRRAPDGRVPQEDIARGAPAGPGADHRGLVEPAGPGAVGAGDGTEPGPSADPRPAGCGPGTDGWDRQGPGGVPEVRRAAKVKLPSDGAGTGVLRWGGPECNSGASAIVEGEGYLG